jgi:hypothetical protein
MATTNWAREVLDLDIALTRIELWVAELRRGMAVGRGANRSPLKYNPNQPRVPAGHPDGGRWTDGGSGEGGGGGTLDDWFNTWLGGAPFNGPAQEPEEEPEGDFNEEVDEGLGVWPLGEEDPDKLPIEQVNSRSRSGGSSWPNASPAQQARLAASDLQAQAAIRRVQELDANWRPGPSISKGIEGAIATNQANIRQAEGRLRELQGMGLGFGPFAGEPIPARGAVRTNAEEQREVNRQGYTVVGQFENRASNGR